MQRKVPMNAATTTCEEPPCTRESAQKALLISHSRRAMFGNHVGQRNSR
jgi:hypothetical protein